MRAWQNERAKLHHGIDFVKVPGQAGAKRHGALELLRVLELRVLSQLGSGGPMKGSKTSITRRSSSRAYSFTCRGAGSGGSFPVHVARAVVVGSRGCEEIVPASALVAFQFAAHERKNFVKIFRRLKPGIHHNFELRIDTPLFSRKPNGNLVRMLNASWR